MQRNSSLPLITLLMSLVTPAARARTRGLTCCIHHSAWLGYRCFAARRAGHLSPSSAMKSGCFRILLSRVQLVFVYPWLGTSLVARRVPLAQRHCEGVVVRTEGDRRGAGGQQVRHHGVRHVHPPDARPPRRKYAPARS